MPHASRHCRLVGGQVCVERAAAAGHDWGCLGACAQQRRIRHGGGRLLGAGASRLLACTLCLSSLSSCPPSLGVSQWNRRLGNALQGVERAGPRGGHSRHSLHPPGARRLGARERSCPALAGKGFLWKERIKVAGCLPAARDRAG